MSRLMRDEIDCRTRLARPNSQARTRTGNNIFSCSANHEQDWQPYPVDPYSCYYMFNRNIGEKLKVILYTYINRYAETPESHRNVMIEFRCVVTVSTPAVWLARENIKRLTPRPCINVEYSHRVVYIEEE